MPSRQYLDLADFLLIAEAVTGTDAATLAKGGRIDVADSALNAPAASFDGSDFYPELHVKAAVLAYRLCNNHPLLDGNKRVAWLCLREFCFRNGFRLDYTTDDAVRTMRAVAAGQMDEEHLAAWVLDRLDALTVE